MPAQTLLHLQGLVSSEPVLISFLLTHKEEAVTVKSTTFTSYQADLNSYRQTPNRQHLLATVMEGNFMNIIDSAHPTNGLNGTNGTNGTNGANSIYSTRGRLQGKNAIVTGAAG